MLPAASDPYKSQRQKMVRSQLEARGIDHYKVLNAMRTVPRHRFVPENMRPYAYDDRPLPLGHRQTISQPYIVGYMTAAIDPDPRHKVLEIGTGSGYQAAVLAEIVDAVFTIEIVPPLGEQASTLLQELGYDNVHVRIGDGYAGWPEQAPFDAIVVTAAAEEIPAPLAAQLKEGGKMIIPIGHESSLQNLVLVTKEGDELIEKPLLPVRFVPFTRDE
jgi:protein-L-isoaspartate(D-aspartate) O-methyltransferase